MTAMNDEASGIIGRPTQCPDCYAWIVPGSTSCQPPPDLRGVAMSDLRPMVKVGQIYASTRKADVLGDVRQRRYVCRVEGDFVWLHSNTRDGQRRPLVRVRFRDDITSQSIPGHRLVEDVS